MDDNPDPRPPILSTHPSYSCSFWEGGVLSLFLLLIFICSNSFLMEPNLTKPKILFYCVWLLFNFKACIVQLLKTSDISDYTVSCCVLYYIRRKAYSVIGAKRSLCGEFIKEKTV